LEENEENVTCSPYSVYDSSSLLQNRDKHGGDYNLPHHGLFLAVPQGAVNDSTNLTVQQLTENSLPAPAGDMEAVVSFIVSIGPSNVVLKKPIVVKLMHSGPTSTCYYENIAIAFNYNARTWEELPGRKFSNSIVILFATVVVVDLFCSTKGPDTRCNIARNTYCCSVCPPNYVVLARASQLQAISFMGGHDGHTLALQQNCQQYYAHCCTVCPCNVQALLLLH